MRPVVVLGLMGAGKTTLGAAVAAATGRTLRDSDADIARDTGRTAAELAEESVSLLHAREAAHLRAALDDPTAVVAAAASVVDDPLLRAELARAFVVWLDAPVEVLARRFAAGAHRPRFGRPVGDLLAAQHARRGGWWEQVADLRLDARRPLGELVQAVCGSLQHLDDVDDQDEHPVGGRT